MNETYYEILVPKKKSTLCKVGQIVTAIMAGVFAFFFLLGMLWSILLAAACGVACYFLSLYGNVEYEYLYVDKELQIDRILAKNSRKRMETLDLNQMEILAPIRSHELDPYRNRQGKTLDYSTGEEDHDNQKYMLVVNDKKIIFEPTEELVKTVRMLAPRKVYTY